MSRQIVDMINSSLRIPFPRPVSGGGGGGTDNTPDAVNWEDITYDVSAVTSTITSKQITGVTSGIYLNLTGQTSNPNVIIYYRVDNTEQTGTVVTDPAPSSPWVQIAEASPGTTFPVNNNQWVSFAGWAAAKNASEQQDVYNASDNNTLLDSFTLNSIE